MTDADHELLPLGTSEYRMILRRLALLQSEAAAHRDEANAWHETEQAALAARVRAADEAVRAAARETIRAAREREQVDARTSKIWSDFVHQGGFRLERFGTRPPAASIPRQRDREAGEYLREAEATVAYQAPPKPLSAVTTLMFAAFGFMGGAVGVAAFQTLRYAGTRVTGDWEATLPVLALIGLILGPILALVGAKRVADRRGVGLDTAAVVTVLISGALTATLLWTVVGRA